MKRLVTVLFVLVLGCLVLSGCGSDEIAERETHFPHIWQKRADFEAAHTPVKSWEGDVHGVHYVFAVYEDNIGAAYAGGDTVVAVAAHESIPTGVVPANMTDYEMINNDHFITTVYNNGVTLMDAKDKGKELCRAYTDRDAFIWLSMGMK